MYLPIPTQKTFAAAWLKAAEVVDARQGHEAQNVILDVAEPLTQTTADGRVVQLADTFLKKHAALPLQSVANTIFPEPLCRRHSAQDLYDVYFKIYERGKRKKGDWGRYFERMIRRRSADGQVINPLACLIAKMKQHVHGGGRTFRNVYELTISDPALDLSIYDAARDAGRVMNRQCLSFMSFKLDDQNRLLLTALYRNHYYIQRLLGNLIGLARLMAFVGRETDLEVGALTVISTHAQIDIPNSARRADIAQLLADCKSADESVAAA